MHTSCQPNILTIKEITPKQSEPGVKLNNYFKSIQSTDNDKEVQSNAIIIQSQSIKYGPRLMLYVESSDEEENSQKNSFQDQVKQERLSDVQTNVSKDQIVAESLSPSKSSIFIHAQNSFLNDQPQKKIEEIEFESFNSMDSPGYGLTRNTSKTGQSVSQISKMKSDKWNQPTTKLQKPKAPPMTRIATFGSVQSMIKNPQKQKQSLRTTTNLSQQNLQLSRTQFSQKQKTSKQNKSFKYTQNNFLLTAPDALSPSFPVQKTSLLHHAEPMSVKMAKTRNYGSVYPKLSDGSMQKLTLTTPRTQQGRNGSIYQDLSSQQSPTDSQLQRQFTAFKKSKDTQCLSTVKQFQKILNSQYTAEKRAEIIEELYRQNN